MKNKKKNTVRNSGFDGLYIFKGFIGCLILLVIMAWVLYLADSYLFDSQHRDWNETHNTDSELFIDYLVLIEKNCGNTHITQKYDGGIREYYVFREVCIGDGYCKYEYTPIEECLK